MADTAVTKDVASPGLVAIDDQNRAGAIAGWFFNSVSTLLKGNEASSSASASGPLSSPGPALGITSQGLVFIQGQQSGDTASGTQQQLAAVNEAAKAQITNVQLLVVAGLVFLLLRKA